MSGAREETRVPLNAQDVDARAAQFLVRRRTHAGWSADDQAEFDAWSSQSMAHETEYWRLETVWDRADRLNALRRTSVSEEPALRDGARLLKTAAAIVAVMTFVVTGVLANFLLNGQRTATYSTPVGGHMAVHLADGSRVELNTDTVLRASMAGKERSVTLEKGEAFFQIKHDRLHPFFVTVAGHRVVDLGTKFLVRRSADRVEVALVEGRARIETTDASLQPHAMDLRPGDFAVATAASMSVSKEAVWDLTDQLGWRRGVLIFRHVALADAVAEFNRYNSQQLVVVGPSIERLEIVGTFPVNGTALFGRAVKNVLGLNVERHGEEILISR